MIVEPPRVDHGRGLLRRLGKIDRRAFDSVAAAHLPGLEYVLPRLSRAADHGVLWFTTAGVMAVSRRARLRRAALRGSIGIAVASPVVNIIGKQAFRRKRPVVDLVPPIRIRWKLPTSHAFPSGHSASAAAFAAGVAMEAPRAVAVPVAATAAAVAFSRVYTGAHYPGDVLAGVGIGMLAGLGTRLVWPARPPVAHVSRRTTRPVEITENGEGLVVVVNGKAGVAEPTAKGGRSKGGRSRSAGRQIPPGRGLVPGRTELDVAVLLREFPAAEIIRAGQDEDLEKLLDEAAKRATVLAVVGGDGTVNAGARAALKHDVPLLPIPGGTFDHFARALGIEAPMDAVAAYREGCVARVDVGSITSREGEDGLIFLNTASFGAYPELILRRRRLETRLGKWPALAVAAVRTLRHSKPIEMVVDGRKRRVWMAFVGNGTYGSRGAAPTWRDQLDDGRLDIRMITTGKRVPRVRALAAVLLGHLHITPGYQSWHGGSLELIATKGDLRLAHDGELSTVRGVVKFAKKPGALSVFCPRMQG
ncbi:bifunctional phosphatase PAP2/diacylglycerol kinase family protein [Actinomadura rudentiformis]|uniref:bifunctional phosphatase PAP2/diacylglycerol kinase family protein n=1 Tax=Actinomadura rudentiformis TaxID=359158 RepID=UPI001CEF7163|nr:bifunctional phosphatase PAP2/diacylglycerol kinase family protein [Actinomadura rudentiformis]